MAKLKAPLLSLGAAGAIGKTLVFFNWKGLDVVREYVIPANPQSDPQIAQRSFLTAAVTDIHAAQARPTWPLDEDDQTAYSLYGSTFPTPRTWFNTIVKNLIDLQVDEKARLLLSKGAVSTAVALKITFTGTLYPQASTAGKLHWGKSKTNMPNSIVANAVVGEISADADPTVKGTKYFLQWRPDAGGAYEGMRSGIYTAIST